MMSAMRIYLAGPLFSEAERAFLSGCAERFRAAGLECFVPHQHERQIAHPTPAAVFALDYEQGLKPAHALVAWLDGPQVDDGTACEIGLFRGLLQGEEPWRKGMVGLVTDLRLQRRRPAFGSGGLNLFLAGAIESAGRICWSLDEALDQLLAWRRELGEGL